MTGIVSSEAPADLSVAAVFPVWEAQRQDLRAVPGPAVMHQSARRWYLSCTPGIADNHQRSRLWISARCLRTQRPYRRPPHPRGLRPHRRLSSMSPVSPGRHHRMRTECLATRARGP